MPEVPPAPTTVEAFRANVVRKLLLAVGKDGPHARPRDLYVATALATRDHVVERWMEATRRTYDSGAKRVYYFSLEFLIGRQLLDALNNLGLTDTAREALAGLGLDLDAVRAVEPDPGLGNGGLGRLAACFMESMASLEVPAYGYGIRSDHGIFRQVLRDGWQMELPEEWLSTEFPWEFERPEVAYPVGFGGEVTTIIGADGRARRVWRPAEYVKAVAYDTPITGWRGAQGAVPVTARPSRPRDAAHQRLGVDAVGDDAGGDPCAARPLGGYDPQVDSVGADRVDPRRHRGAHL
ncbi:MAG: glycogen/starch/alpha-glucan phosphorylase, partial [Gemmatimonadota bacterium]